MSPAPSPAKPAKPKPTFYTAFTDTWSDARMRRAQRERATQERREKRRKPQPWILRKLAVGFVLALLGWLQYVYVGRLCVPMLRKESDARGTFAQGVGYLIAYEVLWLIATWSYITIITVGPGFARNHIKRTLPPQGLQARAASPSTFSPSTQRTSSETVTTPLRPTRSQPFASHSPSHSHSQSHSQPQPVAATTRPDIPRTVPSSGSLSSSRSRGPVEFPENNPVARPFGKDAQPMPAPVRNGSTDTQGKRSAEMGAAPGLASVNTAAKPIGTNGVPRSPTTNGAPRSPTTNGAPKRPDPAVRPSWDAPPARDDLTWAENLPPSRRPNHPVLSPDRRYCYKCEIVKPYRSHHCSVCATDVLMFDHHCLWIGQCVGARNRKFFVNFLEWAVLLCIYIFVTLIISNATAPYTNNLDGEMIAIIGISGFFGLFTGMLLYSHLWLTTINATTVEHMWMQTLQRKDTAALQSKFAFWNLVGQGKQRRAWNREWGSLFEEGNIWWLGSRRANWEALMGTNPLWWFLPIGRSKSDGLSYPVNPRFSSEGRWRRRSEWPRELQ